MSHRSGSRSSVNYGIQGNVTAGVVAVGENATAIQYQGGIDPRVTAAIAELRAGLDALIRDPGARAAIEEDVEKLESAASQEPDAEQAKGALENLAGKLKMIGVMISETVSIGNAVRKLGGLLGMSLSFLGL